MTLVSKRPITTIAGASDRDVEILRQYAEFWKIPYAIGSGDQVRQAFVSADAFLAGHLETKSVIVSPSRSSFQRLAERFGLGASQGNSLLSLPFARNAEVAIRTEVFQFSGSNIVPVLKSGNVPLLYKVQGRDTYLLTVDLIGEYSTRVYGGFEESPDWKFRLATKLPFSYQTIPGFIREKVFRAGANLDQLSPDHLAPVEFLKTLFLASLVIATGPVPFVGFWKRGKSYALVVTHDVETADGLEKGTYTLLGIERELGLRSTWNIPSERYPISADSIRDLDRYGEIGAHDTRHDGRLILLNHNDQSERLARCKDRLEFLSERRVRGFRAPLLQHSPELAKAEASAGFEYDSSCPSYELLSPTSMKAHGVGTLFPFEMNGVLEIPVSLPQDHQLIRVAGQTPREAVDMMLFLSMWIKRLGGPCVILVHPDYELAQTGNLLEYRRLLEEFSKDPECQSMTLGELKDWWKYRSEARWEATDNNPELVSDRSDVKSELQTALVSGYGADGFILEAPP